MQHPRASALGWERQEKEGGLFLDSFSLRQRFTPVSNTAGLIIQHFVPAFKLGLSFFCSESLAPTKDLPTQPLGTCDGFAVTD